MKHFIRSVERLAEKFDNKKIYDKNAGFKFIHKKLTFHNLRRKKAHASYVTLKDTITGTPVEYLPMLLRSNGITKVNNPVDENEMNRAPRTDIEKLLGGLPFGNTSSDVAFTAENDRFQFLVVIHYGLCYVSLYYLDKKTIVLKYA